MTKKKTRDKKENYLTHRFLDKNNSQDAENIPPHNFCT